MRVGRPANRIKQLIGPGRHPANAANISQVQLRSLLSSNCVSSPEIGLVSYFPLPLFSLSHSPPLTHFGYCKVSLFCWFPPSFDALRRRFHSVVFNVMALLCARQLPPPPTYTHFQHLAIEIGQIVFTKGEQRDKPLSLS